MAASSSSGSSVSARRRAEFGEAAASSPVRYRVGPLQYSPAVMCKCGKKAARWISWSDENPGRRYLKCFRQREGGCDLYTFVDREPRTDFVNELFVDLRDTVWRLKKEKKDLVDGTAEAEKIIEEQRREMEAMRRQLGYVAALASELDGENAELRCRTGRLEKELQKERLMFAFAFLVVVGVVAVSKLFM